VTPSLDRQPIMRLVGGEERTRHMLTAHDHIYLSDLSDVSLAGLDLRGKTFYGCRFGPSSWQESSLAECELVGCIFDSTPPSPTNQAAPPEDAELIEQSLALLRGGENIASAAAEFLSGRVVPYEGRAGRPLATQHANIFSAFLYLSANHPSAFVRQEITMLASRASIDPAVAHYLVDRTSSGDAEERAWVLTCLARSNLDVLGMFAPPRVPRLLRDDSPQVVRATVEFLLAYCSAPDSLKPILGADAEALSRELLSASDPELSRRALLLFKSHFELVPFDTAHWLLQGSDPTTREIAFEGLFFNTVWSLEPNPLLDYEPTDDERRRMLAWEKETRDAYGDGRLLTSEEMTEMLESPEAAVRAEGLRVLGFTGDERFAEAARHATGDQDPRVRLYAVRALKWMEKTMPGGALRVLLEDESAEVRHEAESLFRTKDD